MPDVTLPDGSDPTWNASSIGTLGQAGIRALAKIPYVMATASGGQDPSETLARAVTANNFMGPLAGMMARDTMATAAKAIYGPAMGAWLSSQLGPMDDPIRLMAQQAVNGSPPPSPTFSSLAALLAGR